MIRLGVLLLVGSSVVQVAPATASGVQAIGVYPLSLPGLQADPSGPPRVLLWCHGVNLLGVMAPGGDLRATVSTGPQGPSLPSGILLKDGRCKADGGVSFGFLVPMKAWVLDSAVRTPPQERRTWLLHRFQGTVSDRSLKGVLVQVDISHPGFAFREAKVEIEALAEDQASFADEGAWRQDVTSSFDLEAAEP